ncbi:MAG: hypothetical protein IJS20_04505 [Bacteroidales bacterium]|nr:hypothetical protein [Bacteroidales bacterium]
MKKISRFLIGALFLGLTASCSNQNQNSSKLILPHSESTSVEGNEASDAVAEDAKPASVSPTSKDEYQIPESADFLTLEEDDLQEAVRLFKRLDHKFFDRWTYSKRFYKYLKHAVDVPETNLEFAGTCDLSSKVWLRCFIDPLPHSDSIVPKGISISKISEDAITVRYDTLVRFLYGQQELDDEPFIVHLIREEGSLVVDEITKGDDEHTSFEKKLKDYITNTRTYFKSEEWQQDYEKYCKENDAEDAKHFLTDVEEYFKKYPKWDN